MKNYRKSTPDDIQCWQCKHATDTLYDRGRPKCKLSGFLGWFRRIVSNYKTCDYAEREGSES